MTRLPVALTVLLLTALPAAVSAQVVHPAGAAITTIGWQPASNTDSLRVDTDGDNIADITFQEENHLPTGAGQATTYRFTVHISSPGTELALDSAEFDSAHRFIINEGIGAGLRWAASRNAQLAYTITGNGGTGGRGFFRNGETGYIVIRKQVAGNWRYWWFNITGRTAVTRSQVSFYGHSGSVLTTARASSFPIVQVVPNPTSDSWQLTGTGNYQLMDSQGRILQSGAVHTMVRMGSARLASGVYLLRFQNSSGTTSYQRLVRE